MKVNRVYNIIIVKNNGWFIEPAIGFREYTYAGKTYEKNLKKTCTNINKEMVKKAYQFADKAHKKQKRESGDPYIMHPVEVACILADMGMDTSTIVAGLLHDVVEDTEFYS